MQNIQFYNKNKQNLDIVDHFSAVKLVTWTTLQHFPAELSPDCNQCQKLTFCWSFFAKVHKECCFKQNNRKSNQVWECYKIRPFWYRMQFKQIWSFEVQQWLTIWPSNLACLVKKKRTVFSWSKTNQDGLKYKSCYRDENGQNIDGDINY